MAWFPTRTGAAVGLSFLIAVTAACGGKKQDAKTPLAASSGGSEGTASPAEVGKAAPDLSIQTVNGKGQVSLASLVGSVVVVDFWATWCLPCKQSFPKLEEIAKQNPGKVQVVGISVDDKQDGVADFAKSNGATFAIGWDDGHAIANRWKVDSMPTTYVLDATGTVRFIHAGYHDGESDAIAKEIASLTGASTGKDVATSGAPRTGASGADSSPPSASTKPSGTDGASQEPAADPPPVTKPKKSPPKPAKVKPPARGPAKAPPKKKP